jgi:pantoate--beta-alanine ligase
VQIVVCPIVREPDGLAMSSRNAYLDSAQRKSALVLHDSLVEVQNRFDQGERNAARLIDVGKEAFTIDQSVRLDYLEIVDPETLDRVDLISSEALVAVAACVGKARLIDNIVLVPAPGVLGS